MHFTDKMTNFATQNMNRTFHYKASFLNYVAVVVVAVGALLVFWHRSEGLLVVNNGRFSRSLSIRVSDILSAEVVRAGVLPVRYVLIKYGAGHEVSVQPDNEEAFIREIKRRQIQAEEMEG